MKLVLKYNFNSYNLMSDKMYQIRKLPYSYYSLELFIDTHTLGLHQQKHQKGYLKKLNDLLIKNNYVFTLPMEVLSYHKIYFLLMTKKIFSSIMVVY